MKRIGLVAGGLVLVACIAAVVVAACHGLFALAAVCFGAALFWGIPFGQRLFVARVVPRAEVAAGATVLRPGRSVDVLAGVMMMVGLVTGAALAALGALGTVTFPFGGHYPLGYVILGGGWALFCASYLVTMARNRGTAYLRLTPADVAFVEGFQRGRGSWADVVTINDDAPRGQSYARCAISVAMRDGSVAAIPNGKLYAANGNALREWIRFYWEHPECRAELADARALERLRTWTAAAA